MNIYFITFGCKVNAGENQYYLSQLIEQGFTEALSIQDADIAVINTCAVTETAAKKSARYIEKLKKEHKDLKIIVTGCLTEEKGAALKEYGADIIVTNGSKSELVNHIINLTDGYVKAARGSFAGGALLSHTSPKTRAFFKIQDGCDACCTYCIIPELRGSPKSMPKDEVISGFKKLLSLGYKEIVLVGIHIGLYGKDLGLNITDILEELVKIEGDFRIRLTSIEINEIDDKLLYLIKDNRKICPHLHIPLQSGCDKILSLMGRKYKKDDYIKIIKKSKDIIPNVTIGSDIIAGFPEELDDDFNDTLITLKTTGTEFYHAFPYSERKGTVAESMQNKVDVKTREERAAVLRKHGQISLMNLYNKSIGKIYRVLSEKGNKGHTENYMLIHYDKNIGPNQFINVLVKKVENGKLYGEVVENSII